MPKYNLERFLIPLSPLFEQKRMVAEIEKQLAKVKRIKKTHHCQPASEEQLLKALLHGVFDVDRN